MQLLTGLLLSFMVAAGIGLGSTWYALTQNLSFGALELGAWKGYPRNGTVGIDPYARAVIARNGELPVGSGDGVTFTAAVDDSGRPLVITMNNDLAGLLFNGVKRPNRVDGTSGVTELSGFDPGKSSFFNKAAWTDPGPLAFGNAPARDGTVRGFMNIVEDVSIFKVTSFHERYRLRFEAQGGNVTNRVVFCDPGITGSTNYNSGSFGAISLQCNQPRSVQFGMKFEY